MKLRPVGLLDYAAAACPRQCSLKEWTRHDLGIEYGKLYLASTGQRRLSARARRLLVAYHQKHFPGEPVVIALGDGTLLPLGIDLSPQRKTKTSGK